MEQADHTAAQVDIAVVGVHVLDTYVIGTDAGAYDLATVDAFANPGH